MSSARARRRRRPVAPHKLRRHAQPGPRAAALSVFFFLLCYEIFILRAPPEPSLPPPRRTVSTPPTGPPSQRAPPPPPTTVPPSSTTPNPGTSPAAAAAAATAFSKAAGNVASKAAVSPAASPVSVPTAPVKARPATLPPLPISRATSLNDTSGNTPRTSPLFEPLKKKHSHAHSKRSTVSSSLLEMEKQAADSGDDAEPSKQHKSAPSSDQPHESSKSEQGAQPGSGENFWQWFQETKGKESEGTTSIECPVDNERVCLMFYKYLRKYKIRSTYDVSCARNLDWMPLVLKRAGNELWGFKYYCGLPDGEQMELAKEKFHGMSYVEFVTDQWWRLGFKDDTELLFAWDTLPHIAYGRIWSFFVKAKNQNIKYILFDNYPGIMNDPSPKRQYLNIRKHPFRFPAAKEVVQNVTEPGETEKRQLLFYESSMLPDDLQ